jgi:probable rRNA maturation factor
MLTIANRQRKHVMDLDRVSDVAKKLLDETLDVLAEKPPAGVSRAVLADLRGRGNISLVFVGSRSIRSLNARWRGIDKATDVLSFSLEPLPPPVGLPWEMGEIFICVEAACQQAVSYGHSVERELAFLLVHGVLHLLGFDHATGSQEREMLGRQEEILKRAGFPRQK